MKTCIVCRSELNISAGAAISAPHMCCAITQENNILLAFLRKKDFNKLELFSLEAVCGKVTLSLSSESEQFVSLSHTMHFNYTVSILSPSFYTFCTFAKWSCCLYLSSTRCLVETSTLKTINKLFSDSLY